MANKSKQFKKFASSGKLKETITKRRKDQQSRRKADDRTTRRAKQRGAPLEFGEEGEDGSEDDEKDVRSANAAVGGRAGGVAKNVEELFGQGGLDGVDNGDGSDLEDLTEDDEESEEGGSEELEGEDDLLDEEAMKKAMKDLEKKDPEFFKYLKDNDGDLLEFGKGKSKAVEEDSDVEMDGEDEDDDEEDEEEEEGEEEAEKKISVTVKMVRQWQEGMIKQHSLRSLRKTLLAFRTAAHMNEDDADQGTGLDTKYRIDSAQVFNKIVITALKFTPVVVSHHLPYKVMPNGKVRLNQNKTNPSLNRLLLSHFSTLLHLIKSLPSTPSSVSKNDDEDAGGLLLMAVGESTKLLPWVMGARKHVRAYLKVLLDLWSSAGDNVRIASFLAIRALFTQGDEAIKDICLRNTYRSLLPPMRNTTPHTLPSLNLMKNTAAELFLLSQQQSYNHAFTFIRMLAVHLRTVVRSSTSGKGGENQEAFRAVYNWQYVHAVDFWAKVLAGAAGVEAQKERSGLESPLKPLIYPLSQIALGVVRLLPSSRYFPLRFHILHSLIRLLSQTNTYIPLSPFLLEILDSSEFKKTNPKKSSLKPLDFEYVIRAPAAYQKTRIYQESLGEELTFLLGEYHASTHVCNSIAFPEISLPVIVMIKRHIKKNSAGSPKVVNGLKVLVDKLESQRTLVENKRRGVGFAPRDRAEVGRFEEELGEKEGPLAMWMRLLRKVRDAKRREVERALREEVQSESEDDEE